MKRAEFHTLTGLRGLAALWVLVYHYIARNHVPDLKSFIPLFQTGYLGVDLFFVLSGFVLAHTYRDTASASLSAYGQFLRNGLPAYTPFT
jgi:peptidoglycan/LPS O-acetylase OafA/YrhL